MASTHAANRRTSQSASLTRRRSRVSAQVLIDQHLELQGFASLSKADRNLLMKAVEAALMNKSLNGLARKKKVSTSDLEQRVRAAERKLNLAVEKLRGQSQASPGVKAGPFSIGSWTSEKNDRRLELIRKETYEQLTADEASELATLQHDMFTARDQFAPIPLTAVQKFHDAYMSETALRGEAG